MQKRSMVAVDKRLRMTSVASMHLGALSSVQGLLLVCGNSF